jgi:hypothetical protein
MNSQMMLMAGVTLMTLCGLVLGRQMGLEGGQQIFVAGFALSIVLICQVPVLQLHRRISELEQRLAARTGERR